MYHSDDAYEQILEDIGNMRVLTDDQFSFLCGEDKTRILAALYTMNKSQELLLGVLPPMCLSSKKMHKSKDDLTTFSDMVTAQMKSVKIPRSIKKHDSDDSTDCHGDNKWSWQWQIRCVG